MNELKKWLDFYDQNIGRPVSTRSAFASGPANTSGEMRPGLMWAQQQMMREREMSRPPDGAEFFDFAGDEFDESPQPVGAVSPEQFNAMPKMQSRPLSSINSAFPNGRPQHPSFGRNFLRLLTEQPKHILGRGGVRG